jgi:hypothetical protein
VEVPAEKGYVWFTVEETITSPTTSPYAIGKAAAEMLSFRLGGKWSEDL